jgi:hypothetical protein
VQADFAGMGGMGGFAILAKVVRIEPFGGFFNGLLHKSAHGQADHEAARPGFAVRGIGVGDAVPEPGENYRCGLAEAGGDRNEV